MKLEVEDAKIVDDRVALEDLEGHDRGLLERADKDLMVEEMSRSIVRTGRKERVFAVVLDGTDGATMELVGEEGFAAKIEIEPADLSIVRTDDKVVAIVVDRDAGDETDAGGELLCQRLAYEIVDAHLRLRRHKQKRLVGMECHDLGLSLWFLEGRLGVLLRHSVHQH